MTETVRLREKIAYGASDVASNLSWGTVGTFLMIYYTDVAKIPALAVGTLFLITRIWDAVNDPIMGIIIDKTHSRWGKCRPYFLWMCLPLGILMVLTYSVPQFSGMGKLVYAYITFTFLGMVYTAINIPVTAILPRLSSDPGQRTVLGAFRMFGALMGGILVNALTYPAVLALGKGSLQRGYTTTLSIYAVVAIALFLFAFFNVKEINLEKSEKKVSIAEGIRAAKGNLPWVLVLLVGLVLQLTMGMRGAAQIYYCKYVLKNDGLIAILGAMAVVMLIPVVCLPAVVKRLGKRNTVSMGILLALAGSITVLFSGSSIPLLFAGNIVIFAGFGFSFGLLFVLISDTVDYGEWKNGVRSEGFLSAAASFGQKLGIGLGGAFAAWVLGFGGYVENAAEQNPGALAAIRFNYAVVPVLACIVIFILMCFYGMDKIMPQMTADLEKRHAEA
ncbi:MAG: glycoside-pentoside-hexuronide (GPH):cation symporter [Treponema sp.]|jgi:GPH family glycoside/pentoside/hexuronide:cation symporter|nr:glycoside-pentoside-hexuronide (GPH):cation symporter [Treponema sp.]